MIPEETEFLCSFGYTSTFYDEASAWLDESDERKLVFISREAIDDPVLLSNLRIQVYYLESPLQIELFAKKVAWAAVFRKLSVLLLDESEEGKVFRSKLEKCHLAANLLLSEASDFQVGILKNGRANQKPFRRGLDLKNSFANVPAVIVGAGPSLKKNGHLLREFKDKGLVLAGGSALNIIDVEPDFAASIDKQAPFEQFRMHPFLKTPFFYQNRMNCENFSLIHGERFLFPDSFSSALNFLQGEDLLFDGGWTVGNFLTAVAVLLGCNPIIFIGMDLCYKEGQKYAGLDSPPEAGLIQVENLWTQKDWLMSAKWTEELAEKEKNRSFINATEGGLGFNVPVKTKTFAEVLALCPKWESRSKQIDEALEKLPLISSGNRWAEWDLSLQRCRDRINIEEEIVYQMLLHPLWEIWAPVFERELSPHDLDKSEKMKLHQSLFFEQVLSEHIHARGPDCIPTGERREYFYKDGTPKTIESYLDGKREGEALLYWPNGKLKRKCSFHQGSRHGSDQMWNEEGIKVDEGVYKMGKPIGIHSRWSGNGQLIEEIEYLDGSRFNLRGWDEKGTLRVEAIWNGPTHYYERIWDRFQKIWVEKRGRWDGKKLVYL